jgi:hypothetical protein
MQHRKNFAWRVTVRPCNTSNTYSQVSLLGGSSSNPGQVVWGIMTDKMTLGQVLSEYLGYPCQLFHHLLHAHMSLSSSGAGTVSTNSDRRTSWTNLIPPHEYNKNKILSICDKFQLDLLGREWEISPNDIVTNLMKELLGNCSEKTFKHTHHVTVRWKCFLYVRAWTVAIQRMCGDVTTVSSGHMTCFLWSVSVPRLYNEVPRITESLVGGRR